MTRRLISSISLSFLLSVFCLAQSVPDEQLLRDAVQLHQAGKYAAAISDYELFLKAHPDGAMIRSNLGAALVHEGRYADAVREYKLALAADPANTGIRFNLALAYYKSGDLAQAVPEFNAVRKSAEAGDPQQRRATVLEAECYLAQGNDKRTIELLEPLASDPSSDLATLYLLGTALIHDNQQERGAEQI